MKKPKPKPKKKPKNKGGRPTKYKLEYCKQIIEFFDIPHTIDIHKTKFDAKTGKEYTWCEDGPNILPTFEKFAVKVDVCEDTLQEWKKAHPKFSVAYRKAQHLQRDMLNDLAMRGFYSASYTKFVAINITDMKDTRHTDLTSKDKQIFPNIEIDYDKEEE